MASSCVPHSGLPSADGPTPIQEIRVTFDVTAESIEKRTVETIEEYQKVIDAVASEQNPTFENCLQKLARAEAVFNVKNSILDFPQYVHVEKEVREASSESDKKVSEFLVDVSMNKELYGVVKRFSEGEEGKNLEGEDARYLKRLLRDFKRNGLELSEEKQDELKELKKIISKKCIDFTKNLNEDTSHIIVKKKDLAGLPSDFISGLEAVKKEGGEEGKEEEGEQELKVTCQYPHAFPTLKQCSVEETRKRMEKAFQNRGGEENVKIAEEVFALKHKSAQILGYDTWASFILEVRMAKETKNVMKFYEDLVPKLDLKAKEELQVLVDLKKKHFEEQNKVEEFDGKINGWDFGFYSTKLLKEKYGLDEEAIKHYFPTSRVVEETFKIYEELLSLKYEKVDGAQTWHQDVECYKVIDKETNTIIGFFLVDLHPREGKYGHACAVPIQAGCEDGEGKRQLAVSVMICNFPKATSETPALLRHSDFVTFFHEFGHIMHGIIGHTKYARFAGTSVERDFVECPSQTLEHWCWQKEILKRVSQHHETKETLPDELIEKMLATKNVNTGLTNLRQVFFGMFDQTVHSQEKTDSETLYSEMRTKITHVPQTPGTNPTANFGHLLGGYDASYYGYMWADVFSSDVFSIFKEKGLMDPATGKSYRENILAPGGSEDAEIFLRRFLGRDPNQDAFLEDIGVKQ